MKAAYLDLFTGLSGDIFLGMLVDAGAELKEIARALRALPVKGYRLEFSRVARGAVSCGHVDVHVRHHGHHHTDAGDILKMLRRSKLPPRARDRAVCAFERLAQAEAKVHGTTPEKVHFHEVGAIDSIVDTVGSCVGLELLGVDQVYCSAVPVGRGAIRMEHGELPSPGPATMHLLKGFPTVGIDVAMETVTPTGASLLAALVERPGVVPSMTIESIGYGAGDDDPKERPNFARMWVGTMSDRGETADLAWLIETNLDDSTGQEVGHLLDHLHAAGALDVWTTAASMKKSRPAVIVSALAEPERVAAVERAFLRESTTFGVRKHLVERRKLARTWQTVETRFGPIRMKVGALDGVRKAQPEYEDVRKAAEKHGATLAEVAREAVKLYE